MCGITGTFSADPLPPWIETVTREQNQMMNRRGPDSEGFWATQHIAVGFRRLSIIDLTREGNQPMLSPDGRYILVFNGEIYNFKELRQQLKFRGLKSQSDTEVLLHWLIQEGVSGISDLNGMFAFAFYDSKTKNLILARDPLGIKPLYYSSSPEGVIFGSQLDQILTHPFFKKKGYSNTGLAYYLRLGYVPPPFSILEDVYQVHPGQCVQFHSSHQPTIDPFFTFPIGEMEKVPIDLDSFESCLESSVKRHLVSDVPVGVFLSGGIDSSLVAAIASKQSSYRLKSFTIGVEDIQMDETQDAAKTAQYLGLDHHTLMLRSIDAIELLQEVNSACTEPTADYSIFPTYLVSKLASRSVKCILSGDGGDELFWGYPSRFIPPLLMAKWMKWPRPIRYAPIAIRKLFGIGQVSRDVLFPDIGQLFRKKHSLWPSSLLADCIINCPSFPEKDPYFTSQETDPEQVADFMRWNEIYLHLGNVLRKVDRASMHASIEVRVPLLDIEIIKYASRLSWTDCLDTNKRVGKIPLRKVLQRHIPFQTMPKKGFGIPIADWLRGPLKELAFDLLLGGRTVCGLQINSKPLENLFAKENHLEPYAWGLWSLLQLKLWEKNYGDIATLNLMQN